ncbi:chondroitinase family polysaccharide lyase [Photobacterium kishitanii]|uniref:chondroitinase family polysaccharide lyase n=1 Tax=Photobacterium kishitanii TaxID=318456 RepID=UPI00071AEEC3|nr:chondroitinase family polysaccharide lyase [Photobacterium kishitanii]
MNINYLSNNKKRLLTLSIILALSGCNSDNINTTHHNLNGKGAQLEPGGYMYFFENGVPDAITTTAEQALTTSALHFKDGTHSLKWQYDPKSSIIFHQNIGYSPEKENDINPQTFMAWVYNEIPSNKKLTFELGNENNTKIYFKYGLNFSGWRGIAVPFRDMEGTATANMDRLRIIAPDHQGTIYLDQIMVSVPVDNRWPTADTQQPYVNPGVVDMASKNWTALLMYQQMLEQHQPEFNYHAQFNDATGDTANLYQQFDHHLNVNINASISQQKIDDNLTDYDSFLIKQNQDGSWQGKPLDHPKRQNFLKTGIVSRTTLTSLTETVNISKLGKVMLETAKYLRTDSLSTVNRHQLETQFIQALQYALDQGWQGGSGQQIITHVGYQTKEFFDALFISRNLLAEHNLLQPAQQAMMWFNATGRIYEQDEDITASNVDILNTQLQWMIKSFLLLPDQNERQIMLKQLQQWLSKTLLASDGLGGGFKKDGSIFHHSQHYPAYGKDAFGGLSAAIYGLSASPYQITATAHQRIKDALLKMRVYTKNSYIPIVLSGRHPDGKQKITSIPFKWLALAGSPDKTQTIDQQLAAAYENLTDKSFFEDIQAEAEPTGAWAMNYASMAIMRGESTTPKKSWLITARGFSRYLVGNETYAANNLYGRYLQYGQLEITPADIKKRAFSHDGWDWNRYPGTTAVQLPNAELRATLTQLPGAGIEEMLLSTTTYSAANRLNDQAAMFAVKLQGHKKYNQQNFTANKSYFMFDNTVIALGSNIHNDDINNPVQTTLFQHNISDLSPVEVNGTIIDQLEAEQKLDGEITLQDPAGNRYFVTTTAAQPLLFSYNNQISNDEDDGKETQGQFATAVLDHGIEPSSQGYEYAIAIEAQKKEKPQYHLIQKDNLVHAIESANGIEAYAFFAPATITAAKHLLSADTASQIMLQEHSNGQQLKLSVVNPDFAFYQGQDPEQIDANGDQVEVSIYDRDWRYSPSQPVKTQFTLKDKWQLTAPSNVITIKYDGNNTNITTTTVDATPLSFNLSKA